MGLHHTLRRYRQTGMDPADKATVRQELVAAWADILRLRTQPAWTHIDRAHDLSQNAPVLHSHAHLVRCAGLALQRRPIACLRELPLVVMAAPASQVRRAAGIGPGEPGGAGLVATWRMRRG